MYDPKTTNNLVGKLNDSQLPFDSADAALTIDGVATLVGEDFWSTLPIEPAGRITFSDGPIGVRGKRWDERLPSVCFPAAIALGASWSHETAALVGAAFAAEAAERDVDVVLAPTLNLVRTPLSGRISEYLSEDPVHAGKLAFAFVHSLQDCGVGACIKHFIGNDFETDRKSVDVRIDERTLREVYARPFEIVIAEADPWAVMASYNAVNGTPMTTSPLLDDLLRDELGFRGLVVSDWEAVRDAAGTARGGLDLAMPGPWPTWSPSVLQQLVASGEVQPADLTRKVERLRELSQRVASNRASRPEPMSLDRRREAAHKLAVESMTLVRNSGALPLDPAAIGDVVVIGENALVPQLSNGGSSSVFPERQPGLITALTERLPAARVRHLSGARSSRVAVVDAGKMLVPGTAETGMKVRYFNDAGTALAEEVRNTSMLSWLGPPSAELGAETRDLEVETEIALEPGDYLIGYSSGSSGVLSVDGEELVQGAVSDSADPMADLAFPPQHVAEFRVETRKNVRITARVRLRHGLDIASLHLNLEPANANTSEEERARAVAAARDADVAIIVVGPDQETEAEGHDRTHLDLPPAQRTLVSEVVAVNPRTIVVVNSGGPVLLPWLHEAAATLLVWHPGQEFGAALADALTGAAEPGGRLPITWPVTEEATYPSTQPTDGVMEYSDGVHIGYRDPLRSGSNAQLPFGFGLGYTSWEWQDATVSEGADSVTVTTTLRNSGARAGKQVVQVYAHREQSEWVRPAQWLVGFREVYADAGESVDIEITVPHRELMVWDDGWQLEPGAYKLRIGESSASTQFVRTVDISTSS